MNEAGQMETVGNLKSDAIPRGARGFSAPASNYAANTVLSASHFSRETTGLSFYAQVPNLKMVH